MSFLIVLGQKPKWAHNAVPFDCSVSDAVDLAIAKDDVRIISASADVAREFAHVAKTRYQREIPMGFISYAA
jgi:hypothetical protein